MATIHRAAGSGKTRCGKDAEGTGLLITIWSSEVTCKECKAAK